MPRRIAVGTLNASTLDILNVIRQNASYEYQSCLLYTSPSPRD